MTMMQTFMFGGGYSSATAFISALLSTGLVAPPPVASGRLFDRAIYAVAVRTGCCRVPHDDQVCPTRPAALTWTPATGSVAVCLCVVQQVWPAT